MAKPETPSIKAASASLEQKLAAIGVMVATQPLSREAASMVDIEDTIADSIVHLDGDGGDMRWLGSLLAWVRIHGGVVIIEKLVKILQRRFKQGASVEFAALLGQFALEHDHRRWRALLVFAPKSPRLVGPPLLADSLIKVRGEEDWAQPANFLVPRGSLAAESKWVLSPGQLAKLSRQYRNRLIYGPQWRADIITAVEHGARTPAAASRTSGASYEPCHRVLHELEVAEFPPLINIRK